MLSRGFWRAHRHARFFSSSSSRPADFTHAIVGGGAVGLAIARRLQQVEGAEVVLIERHGIVGSETSSRNSEVIHAGIYYGPNTLKTNLCVQGKRMLYDLCEECSIPYANCGKWIVAQTAEQLAALQSVHDHAKSIDVPTRFISPDEAQTREPDVRAAAGALESLTTGIVDSHAYMQYLHGTFEESGGTTALASPVTRILAPSNKSADWKIWTGDAQAPEQQADDTFITASTLINSAGLAACSISNMILPPPRHRTPFYAKGTYFSYSKAHPKPRTLIYPAPTAGHGGLGTHLTLDMAGRLRFGPDVEWVDSPNDLTPKPDSARVAAAIADIKSYLPGLDEDALAPDYCGIRPKLGKAGAVNTSKDGKSGFLDFYIEKEEGFDNFINLLGIESPGLTSSLAIAEHVYEMLYR